MEQETKVEKKSKIFLAPQLYERTMKLNNATISNY